MNNKLKNRIEEKLDGETVVVKRASNGFIIEYEKSLDYDANCYPHVKIPLSFFCTEREVFEGNEEAFIDVIYALMEIMEVSNIEIKKIK